ncbi:SURF1 family protein [Elongatibacter sediminis]|uniref:SURF1-like protein n=1 Tax=Elongatibacter sediminis TaxID=3119006 RepID=A0AAW9RJ11_9GAMM
MRFRFSLPATLLLLTLAAAFAWLGSWQWQRMGEKERLIAEFEAAPELEYSAATRDREGYSRVALYGRFQSDWHVLRDNRIERGRPGVEVFSLFLPDHGPGLLVNRGWLPLPADRRSLPAVPTPDGRVRISGLLAPPPEPGVRLGEAVFPENPKGPILMTYFDFQQISDRMEDGLHDAVLLLDAADPSGFGARAWEPTVMRPGQHRAYAVQWFALAATAVIIWLLLGYRRTRARDSHTSDNGGLA